MEFISLSKALDLAKEKFGVDDMNGLWNLVNVLLWCIAWAYMPKSTSKSPTLVNTTDQECEDIVRIVNEVLLTFNQPVRIKYEDGRITIV